MSVRAKFTCNHIARGTTGLAISFGPVYEGSPELQKISENAIFGDATPGGSLYLCGPHLEDFVQGEEYYIDLFSPGVADPTPLDGTNVGGTLHASVVKVFRSAPRRPDQEWPKTDQLRFIARTGSGWDLSLDMHIANPAAVAYLDAVDAFDVRIQLATGRRSDAEIALRQKMLDDHVALGADAWANSPGAWAKHKAALEHKLARAKGEA